MASQPRVFDERFQLNSDLTATTKPAYGSMKRRKIDQIDNNEDDDDDDDGKKEDGEHRIDIQSQDRFQNRDDEKSLKPRASGLSPDCYFSDGEKRIDFVLVHEEEIPETIPDQSLQRKRSITEKRDTWRKKFIETLKKTGVEMEEERVEGPKKTICYRKLHLPDDVLFKYAEDIRLRAPLQEQPDSEANWSETVLSGCKLRNIMTINVPNKPPYFYTCPFKTSKIAKYLKHDVDGLFKTRDRQCVAYEILAKTQYGKKKRSEIGIDRLIEEGIYNAAFPLHDGTFELPNDWGAAGRTEKSLNRRQVLYEYWAKWKRWYKYQPLDHIREYFGEKIGIYFAWIGFYTAWLLPASVVGVLVFLYGLLTMGGDTEAKETCDSGHMYQMCPLCNQCQIWNLSDNCLYTQISYLFDHPGTVFYAVFMSFWAVTFLEYWKRKTANLAHRWDCLDYQDEEERPRPEYAAKCTESNINPITRIEEPFFPPNKRVSRTISAFSIILFMMCLVIIFIVAVILYRVLITDTLFQSRDNVIKLQASTLAGISASLINLIIIMALSKVYEKLAYILTRWEMHRTQSEFDDQLIFKVFIFQFVNFYSSIIYIGFFKGKFSGDPSKRSGLFGLRQEECQTGSCLIELAQQLAIIMIGKQAINNCQELLLPKLKGFIQRWRIGKTDVEEKKRWEEDYELIQNEGLFEEYLEMILQFGFITIFVAAFPLAPLFALLNNWMEIRLDAHKFICETRRPVAERCQNIGVWFTILECLAHLAVISNAFLIAFTSEFLPKQLYQYQYKLNLEGYVNFTLAWHHGNFTSCRYKGFRDEKGDYTGFFYILLCVRLTFVILFEHVVFGICKLIDIVVPDIPESLEIKIKRERYLAKQALADVDVSSFVASDEHDDAQLPPNEQQTTNGQPTSSQSTGVRNEQQMADNQLLRDDIQRTEPTYA